MQLVKRGIRWSVGDEQKIKVLADRWIPDVIPDTLRLPTPIPNSAALYLFC
jgi:hypothetical protein